VLPTDYRGLSVPKPVTGTVVVEASPWLEDNQWVLDVAAKDTIIVGTVGDLEPGKPEFRRQLERLHRNPLFRGIRCGNLWNRNISAELDKPAFVADLKFLADAGLELDTANQNPVLIAATVRLTDLVPNLRVVIDHLPQMDPPADAAVHRAFLGDIRELGRRPQVYVKVSEVLRRVDGRVPDDLNFYRQRLDILWEIFGEDRLIYGSDWPNSDLWAEYPQVLKVVREYFMTKGPEAAEKYFWKNSAAAYKWVKRENAQPQLRGA
jgi:predicted TIM-barrel fold metal-dependent hydrolase